MSKAGKSLSEAADSVRENFDALVAKAAREAFAPPPGCKLPMKEAAANKDWDEMMRPLFDYIRKCRKIGTVQETAFRWTCDQFARAYTYERVAPGVEYDKECISRLEPVLHRQVGGILEVSSSASEEKKGAADPVECCLAELKRIDQSEFGRNPEPRWREYLCITSRLADLAHVPASLTRYTEVCDLLTRGFKFAAKTPVDDSLEARRWVSYGLSLLAADPKSPNWEDPDEDVALTLDEKEILVQHLFQVLKALLAWLDKMGGPHGRANASFQDFRRYIAENVYVSDSNYWESCLRRKLFNTNGVTRLSSLNGEFFAMMREQLYAQPPGESVESIPAMSDEFLVHIMLADWERTTEFRNSVKFEEEKERLLSEAIEKARVKTKIDRIDFNRLKEVVEDKLAGGIKRLEFSPKMREDLRRVVSNDLMVSVHAPCSAGCVRVSKTILTRKEFDQYGELIMALKNGVEKHVQEAATEKEREEWESAKEMLRSTLTRGGMTNDAWTFIFNLLDHGRDIEENMYPLKTGYLDKKSPEGKAFFAELERQIELFGNCGIFGKRGYFDEYRNFLVGIRDRTLPESKYNHLMMMRNHGIIRSQEDADHAFKELETNVCMLYIGRVKKITELFRKAAEGEVTDRLNRYEYVTTKGVANALCIFNSAIQDEIIIRNTMPLVCLQQYGYYKKVCDLYSKVESAWLSFFDELVCAAPGAVEYLMAKATLDKLLGQLSAQCGIVGETCLPPVERAALFKTFQTQLDALAMKIFEYDSRRKPEEKRDKTRAETVAEIQKAITDEHKKTRKVINKVDSRGSDKVEKALKPGELKIGKAFPFVKYANRDECVVTMRIIWEGRWQDHFFYPKNTDQWKIVRQLVTSDDEMVKIDKRTLDPGRSVYSYFRDEEGESFYRYMRRNSKGRGTTWSLVQTPQDHSREYE